MKKLLIVSALATAMGGVWAADYTTDVVVIGSGGAGLSAAVTLHDAGKKVIVLEKMAMVGGNTLRAEGGFNAAETAQQKRDGIPDTIDQFIADTMKGGHNINDPELVRTLCTNAKDALAWLVSLGGDFDMVGRAGGAKYNRAHRPHDGSAVGPEVIRTLWTATKDRKIDVRTNARVTDIVTGKDGAVSGVKFTSKDLDTWEFQGDWWNPGLYTMFEMPDLFKMGDWWYLVFSEYSDGNKTRYRMSRSINGPWITPADDSFDGRAYYAARTAFDGERRVLFGWVPTRDEGGDPSSYLWGGTFMPLEIVQRADGTLGTKLPDSMLGAFGEAKAVEAFELSCESGKVEQVLAADAGSTYMLDADIELAGDAAGFSVKLAEDAESGLAYEFRANLREGKLEFTAAPQYPWFQVNNMGLERPLFFKGEGTHHVRLVVDDDIATIFVDDVALNARFCNKQGQGVALTVTDGTLKCANATIASL